MVIINSYCSYLYDLSFGYGLDEDYFVVSFSAFICNYSKFLFGFDFSCVQRFLIQLLIRIVVF